MPRIRAIPVLLAIATLVPIGALGWLGVRILRQDRDIERQRRRERLEVSAGRLALEIDRRFIAIEEQLAAGSGILLTSDSAGALLYQPVEPAAEPIAATVFAAADALEFQRNDPAAAAAEYRRLVESPQPAIRAAALHRLGRVLRKAGDSEAALQAYTRLLQMGAVPVEGHPTALLARQARCRIFEKAGDASRLRDEAAGLATALYSGGWRIGQSTFHLYRDMLQQWGAPPPPPVALARTEAAIHLWRSWRSGDLPARGRRILSTPEMPVAVLWTGAPEAPVAWFATPSELEAVLGPLWNAQPLAVSFYDTAGHAILGSPRSSGVTLHPAETRLPFLLTVASDARERESHQRTLLITGLAATFLLMAAAALGLYRVTGREMALARQQSDFVSAVSHEFRTPLTSMRHLTDLLVSGSVPGEQRKQQYYDLLARETERLHRMVESLLSFGRLEAGAYAWQLEPVEPRNLVRPLVEEFRHQQGNGREVVCEMEENLPPIRADREALSRAIWNLLENAGKYSQPDSLIRVFARRNAGTVSLGVEDHGDGISPAEQKKIFQKFVRGAGAKRAGIRGVGVGLALVKRIVEAHGGTVRLESEPGRGSTFILELPCLES